MSSDNKRFAEMFERIINLEDKIDHLNNRINQLEQSQNKNYTEITQDEDDDQDSNKITKSVTQQWTMEQFRANNVNMSFRKGTRKDSGNIVAIPNNMNTPINIKFLHSKSFEKDYARGWHILNNDLLNVDINIYVFLVVYEEEFYTWVFNREELLDYCKQKETDKNNIYHFYFTIQDGRNYEYRDSEYNVSKYYNQWKLHTKALYI